MNMSVLWLLFATVFAMGQGAPTSNHHEIDVGQGAPISNHHEIDVLKAEAQQAATSINDVIVLLEINNVRFL